MLKSLIKNSTRSAICWDGDINRQKPARDQPITTTCTAPLRSAQRVHSAVCAIENNTTSQRPGLALEKRGRD